MENCYLKKTIKFDKHLFTPELVSVLVYPCSHCRYQIRSPFLSPEWQTQPLTLITSTQLPQPVLLQTTGPTYSCYVLTVVTQNRNCITFFLSSLSFSSSASLLFPYYYHHLISHFSGLSGKHSPILGYVKNRIKLGGLIYNLKSFLQLNMLQELQIFAFVCMYSDAG